MPVAIPLLPFTTWAPAIDLTRIPSEEHEIVNHITMLLSSLAGFERKVTLAVLLFEWTRSAEWQQSQITGFIHDQMIDTTSGWRVMAARDGAISIFHFGKTIQALHKNLKLAPTLDLQLNHMILKEGSQEFRTSFPGYEAIRHVIAHVAEFSSTKEQKSAHSIVGPQKLQFGGVAIEIKDEGAINQFSDNLYDNSYVVTCNGKVHSYEVSAATIIKLQNIKMKIYSSFEKATIVKPRA